MLMRALIAVVAASAAMTGSPASAQAFPVKPIRFITGTAGSNSDFLARFIGQGIAGPLGQPVVVDNRSSGFVAADAVSKTPPDGYAMLINASAWYISSFFEKQAYDPVRDFSAVTITTSTPNLLVTHASVPVKTAKELIALAKARPGDLNYGAAGIGGAGHLATELFRSMAGIDIVNISYKGSGRAVQALVAGEIHLLFSDYTPLEAHIKSGRLRALAVTSAQRTELFPGMPALAETLPGYVSISNTGVMVPAKTPTGVIARLNQEIVRFLRTPEARERIVSTGAEVVASSPDELAAWLKADMARWGKVIKDLGLGIK